MKLVLFLLGSTTNSVWLSYSVMWRICVCPGSL